MNPADAARQSDPRQEGVLMERQKQGERYS